MIFYFFDGAHVHQISVPCPGFTHLILPMEKPFMHSGGRRQHCRDIFSFFPLLACTSVYPLRLCPHAGGLTRPCTRTTASARCCRRLELERSFDSSRQLKLQCAILPMPWNRHVPMCTNSLTADTYRNEGTFTRRLIRPWMAAECTQGMAISGIAVYLW
jgi:hypothetical protein